MKNTGNPEKIIKVLEKAERGENTVIGFIGGSITQGAAATRDELCYAARVHKWWCDKFPKSDIKYINAGIGATTSQFGVARAGEDLLVHDPDLVVVEYSVNDNDDFSRDRRAFFRETYEGLIRKLLSAKSAPAVLIVHSVRYNDGSNEEDMHSEVGSYYGIPCISMKEAIYSRIINGDIKAADITADMLHPNDYGHGLVAGVITGYFEELLKCREEKELEKISPAGKKEAGLPIPLTQNAYESAKRLNNKCVTPVLKGFVPDNDLQNGVRDVFKNGWRSREKGAYIAFEFEGSELAVMYRKTVNKPAPIAYITVDNDQDKRIMLDANFKETWGDKAYLETILYHEKGKHSVKIEIEETEGAVSDFYLINIIYA